MDEETLKAARAAETAVKEHDKSCKAGCRRMGTHHRSSGAAKRCPAGEEIWDTWYSYRPGRLPGGPNSRGFEGEELRGHVVQSTQTVGPYTILTLLRDASDSKGVTEWEKHLTVEYLAYVDGKSTNTYWSEVDVDSVLLFAMDWRKNGSMSTGAHYYAARVLGIPTHSEDDE